MSAILSSEVTESNGQSVNFICTKIEHQGSLHDCQKVTDAALIASSVHWIIVQDIPSVAWYSFIIHSFFYWGEQLSNLGPRGWGSTFSTPEFSKAHSPLSESLCLVHSLEWLITQPNAGRVGGIRRALSTCVAPDAAACMPSLAHWPTHWHFTQIYGT